MTTEYDPYQHAAELGIDVAYSIEGLRDQDDAAYSLRRSAIHLRPGMSVVRERCILTHEVGHALNGHGDSRPKHEVIADRYAAEVLVDRPTLLELMSSFGDQARWAHELGITTKILQVYLNVHRMDLARGRQKPYRTRLAV